MDYALKDRRVLMYRCLQVYIEMNQPVMAASLCLELGNALKVKPHAEASQSCLTQSCNAWWSQVILWFSTGDGQTRRSYCALPEGCRAADTNAHWSTAVHGRHGHVQNPHPWVRPDAPASSVNICLMGLFFHRGLRWCVVSVYRHAAAVSGERTAVSRHQHTSGWGALTARRPKSPAGDNKHA